ncbi:MAG: hypothetical protein HOV79_16110 [Hamadaea sp.]|nr:hypothetical protein [Hamadaea sp.]
MSNAPLILPQRAEALSVGDAEFDAVVGHLAATLAELYVPQETIAQIAARIEPLRAQIVTRSSAPVAA